MRNEKDLLRLSMQFFAEDTTAEKEQNSGSADETLLEDLYPEEQEAPQNEETNAAFGGEDDEWILFVREHPDVTELPEQVVKRMAAGESRVRLTQCMKMKCCDADWRFCHRIMGRQ